MKRKVGWIMKAIRMLVRAVGSFCKWLIKAVFRFM